MKSWWRETFAAAIVLMGLAIALGRLATGCALFTPQNAKTVLSVLDMTCLIVNAELPDTDLAKVCTGIDVLSPDIQQILSEQRKKLAKARAMGACFDAGVDGGK